MFQLVQRRVEGTVADAQHIAGNLFQTLADGPSTQGLQRQYFGISMSSVPWTRSEGLLTMSPVGYRVRLDLLAYG